MTQVQLAASGGRSLSETLDDTPLAFWFRHERGARIYDGPDEVHKTVVAREELKAYGLNLRR